MLFCPYCANSLTIGDREDSTDKCWVCPTCPYQFIIERQVCHLQEAVMGYGLPANSCDQISMRTHLKRKEVDDVLGGKEAWANVDKTDTACPKCDHRRAYFRQMQIRSADEPMTTFYKCCECGHQWREN
ncbi:DNA-directed RNA polymerase III subunit RPC10 [Cryptococcus neoformans Bt85]|nr:DNA-directed RNA polymerase III subunit RPC10 [Cryptococcus neoformans var. grubii Bt85]